MKVLKSFICCFIFSRKSSKLPATLAIYFAALVCLALSLVTKAAGLKVKIKVKFTLEQATKAQRWSSSIALLFL